MDISEKVFSLLRKIPRGKVTTYKALAQKCKTSPRAVGRILNSNKNPVKIPCYRVVMSDGRAGGYVHGKSRKIRLLMQEGIAVKKSKICSKKAFYRR